MLKITKSIRMIVAALACLWPIIFFTGLPAAASVLPAEGTTIVAGVNSGFQLENAVTEGRSVFQQHESSFFLDVDAGGSAADGFPDGSASPQHREGSMSLSPLGTVAIIAVLLLAAFNARKPRSRPSLVKG